MSHLERQAMNSTKTVAQSFIEALHRRGIEHVFANSGTDHAPLVDALSTMRRSGTAVPAFHVVPHENLAMAMAQGYYRVSGKPAVVLVHVAVGTANTVCSLMNAWRSNAPVLLVAGRNPSSEAGHTGSRSVPIHWGQDVFDQSALVREFTKWEQELRAYQSIDALVDRALVIAMSEPRGPVYLTLPRELLADPDRSEPTPPSSAPEPAHPPAAAIEELASMLANANRPLLVTSTVGVDGEAREMLEVVADRYALPVLQSWPFAVNIRSAHPMNLRSQAPDWLAAADVVLTVDAAVPWVPRRATPAPDASVIHLGTDPAYASYAYRDFRASRLIAGSSKAGLHMLADALGRLDIDGRHIDLRRKRIAELTEKAAAARRSRLENARGETPVNAGWTAHCLNSLKSDNAVIVNELGVPFDLLEFSGHEVFFGETTAGALGTGVGVALGAKLADPARMVICCVGDGSFMFGNPTPALLVSRVLGIPILVVIANNGMWYAVEQSALDIYPESNTDEASGLPLTRFGYSPDYAAIAAACGAYGETVTGPEQVMGALQRGLARNRDGQAAVIDIVTAPGTR
jgi:acetolactate synthase-1/2/3 large subunit